MTQTPAGWYDDPAPAPPGGPRMHRWWDGSQWTEHVQPAQLAGLQVLTTPDGQRLAGWWHRVGAYVIDGLIIVPVVIALGWPFLHRIFHAYADFFDRTMRASERGGRPPNQFDVYGHVLGPVLGFAAVALAVNFVYNVGFLKAVQGTPGKLITGLRVRLRERPGSLPWRAVLLRWLVQNAGSLVGFIPLVGSAGSLFSLLDVLWPLWDDKNQAVHDKAARTNVVRVRD